MQSRIWIMIAVGKFFEGFVILMTGVALPLIAIFAGHRSQERARTRGFDS